MANIKKIKDIQVELNYGQLDQIYEIIEKYDLEKEQKMMKEYAAKLQGLSEQDRLIKSIELLGEVKENITMKRKREIAEGQYKVYCVIYNLKFNQSEMKKASVEEVQNTFNNFQKGIRKYPIRNL